MSTLVCPDRVTAGPQPCADTAVVAQQIVTGVIQVTELLEHLLVACSEDTPALTCAVSLLGQMGMLADTLAMAHGATVAFHANPATWLFGKPAAAALDALRARGQS